MLRPLIKRVLLVPLLLPGLQVSAAPPASAPTHAEAAALSSPPAPSESVTREITFHDFLDEVLRANLSYAAQRFNVDLAKADAAAAKLWPNPTLSLNADRDLSFHDKRGVGTDGQPALLRQVETRGLGLTQTFDLAGKRRWRVRSADATYRATAANLEDFLRNLKLDASAAFAEALSTRNTLEQQKQAADYLGQLTQAQRTRFEKGDLSEADYLQSRLEELQLRNDLRGAEAAATAAQLALCSFLGRDSGQITFIARGDLNQTFADLDLNAMIAQALATRADLVALRLTRDAAQSGVRLAKAERIPDVDVGVTYTRNGPVVLNHPVDPTPGFNQLGVSLSLPLPLWNRNQHEVRKTQSAAEQAQRQLEAAEHKAEIDLRTAYSNDRAAVERVQEFQGELMRGADTLLAARRYSYERGQTSLLELLAAQRTTNEVQQSYHDALADAIKARIELLRAAGLSDFSL
jgi:cobalt-zinc-cadmium efflux system outer membrane protein